MAYKGSLVELPLFNWNLLGLRALIYNLDNYLVIQSRMSRASI